MNNQQKQQIWQALQAHQKEIAELHMRDWVLADPNRFARCHLNLDGLLVDYSRHRVEERTLALLCALADSVQLKDKIEDLFAGACVNTTESSPALHTALRDEAHQPIWLNGHNIAEDILNTQHALYAFAAQFHAGLLKGATGKTLKQVVNVGIGGSYLGPMMCTTALKDFAVDPSHSFYFISSVDEDHVNEVLAEIDPETTLFIVSSKSFTTLETLSNARALIQWMQAKYGQEAISSHFVAVTAAPEKAVAWGIQPKHVFPIWHFVGGRFSIWSAIGLSLLLMIGEAQFKAFLHGAWRMDQHFRTAAFHVNMPVILALLSIWYRNFFGTSIEAVIPYSHRLRYFIPYLQQAVMESNGKQRHINGEQLSYATSPVIFGEEGCNGQHAYHQLLHQGQELIPVDFILVAKPGQKDNTRHHLLLAGGLSQAEALSQGNQKTLLNEDSVQDVLTRHQSIPGNRPSNILVLERLSPENLGALIALYEHKIFVQAVIWEINPFDQWGIELGKQLLPAIVEKIQDPQESTGLIRYLQVEQGV